MILKRPSLPQPLPSGQPINEKDALTHSQHKRSLSLELYQ